MPIQRSAPAAIGIGTSGGTSGLFGLASSTTACSQSAEVVSSVLVNVVQITVKWNVLCPAHTPSALTVVNVYVWGTNAATAFPGGSATTEVVTGVAGLITLSANGTIAAKQLRSTLCPTASVTVSDEAEITQILGFIPKRWGLIFMNQLGTTLPNTGHSAEYSETYYA